MSNNPYTHLRTLLDDESRHDELNNELLFIQDAGYVRPTKPYTTSLDALIPLWPENYWWSLTQATSPVTYSCWANHHLNRDPQKCFLSDCLYKAPALAMLDALLQILEYEWEAKND